ncbi:P-loop containing nucleoside triphosphate hydrolase protein [Hypoxylon rubiginosum]|uniref:P-loop containing nucleoside triphosphate hydrolase protein n=1 Tax=Hypoxylon rubiginosum TaxID=110542 RepID=A0ACB9Z143_9PEZI|nr:P-loop containing nucleoside triphosphate hydrolase protein [Hypoxylon rubiginosum]
MSDAKELSDAAIEVLIDKLRQEERSRRKLFHQFQQLRGTIRVICRIRPPAKDEGDLLEYRTKKGEFHNHPASLTILETKGGVHGPKKEWTDPYSYERVFLPNETNEDVFEEIGDFVQSFIDGQKACIFCYGQSGTGKTYTMSNLDDTEDREEGKNYKNDGIVPRVKTKLFAEKRRLEQLGSEMEVRGCCYEIYDKNLWLLKAGRSEKKTISKTGSGVSDPELVTLNSPDDFDALVKMGMKTRHFGKTDLNENSSRSHFIISLETSIVTDDGVAREGLLNLVDLAGSERKYDANTEGSATEEGININQSLSALSRVFVDLAEGKRPACKDDLLTALLERSLQRDCMTLMFVMISLLEAQWTRSKDTLKRALDAQKAKMTEERVTEQRVTEQKVTEQRDRSAKSSGNSTPRRGRSPRPASGRGRAKKP